VRPAQQLVRYFEAERLRGFAIDDQLKLGRLPKSRQNISAKLKARVIHVEPAANRPNLENINHFGFVLPKLTTNSCVTKYCNSPSRKEKTPPLRRPSHRNHALENYVAASIASAALLLARAGGLPSCRVERSKARIANLRRDSARRSYRSMAGSSSCARIIANFCGPSGVEVHKFHETRLLGDIAQRRGCWPPRAAPSRPTRGAAAI
jgi:hypothetical protein